VITLTPNRSDKDLVRAYNEAMEDTREDLVCFKDRDVLILTPNTLNLVGQIAEENPEYDCFCGTTNRIGGTRLLDSFVFGDDIKDHFEYAEAQEAFHKKTIEDFTQPAPHHFSGFFFALRRRAWEKVKFRAWSKDNNILGVDSAMHQDLFDNGFKTCIMKGIYLFHIYRFGSNDTSHLT